MFQNTNTPLKVWQPLPHFFNLMKETPCIRMELELIIYLYFACLERFLNVILEHNLYYLVELNTYLS